MPNLPELLTERWKTQDGQRRLKAVVETARNDRDWGRILEGFPFVDELRTARDLRYADLAGVNLVGADLRETILRKANLDKANLSRARLAGSDLSWADLIRTDLRETDLSGAKLTWTCLIEADLSGATLIGSELESANLAEAKLHKANLIGADLTMAKLMWADLSEASLLAADLAQADLTWASLRVGSLKRSNLRMADLSFADLGGADLTCTDFSEACLYETNFTGAKQRGTCWPPSVDASDVWLASDPSPSCVTCEVEELLMSGWPVANRYVSEHVAKEPCGCGGHYEILRQSLLAKQGEDGDTCYDQVRCRCVQCGKERSFTFDVTQVLAKYDPRSWPLETEGSDWNGEEYPWRRP